MSATLNIVAFPLKARFGDPILNRIPATIIPLRRPVPVVPEPVVVNAVHVDTATANKMFAQDFYRLYNRLGMLNETGYYYFCDKMVDQGAGWVFPTWPEVKAILDFQARRRDLGGLCNWADADRPENYRD